jgi:hypothetical protein
LENALHAKNELRFLKRTKKKVIHAVENTWRILNRFVRSRTEQDEDGSAIPAFPARLDPLLKCLVNGKSQQDKIRDK